MITTWKTLSLCILASLAAALLGCAPAPTTDTTPVRIAVLPIVEGLPLYAAQDGGFFEKQGLKVEFIPTSSAAERDQLLAAGQADATINDLLAVALFNRDSIQLQVVRFALVSAPGVPMYVIAAAPGSGIKNVKDLAGIDIAISQGSIIDYVTNRMLDRQRAGDGTGENCGRSQDPRPHGPLALRTGQSCHPAPTLRDHRHPTRRAAHRGRYPIPRAG